MTSRRNAKAYKPQIIKKMKTNFTNLRNAIFVLLLSLAFTSAFSQNGNPAISNLKATVENNNLVMNWNVSAIEAIIYA